MYIFLYTHNIIHYTSEHLMKSLVFVSLCYLFIRHLFPPPITKHLQWLSQNLFYLSSTAFQRSIVKYLLSLRRRLSNDEWSLIGTVVWEGMGGAIYRRNIPTHTNKKHTHKKQETCEHKKHTHTRACVRRQEPKPHHI